MNNAALFIGSLLVMIGLAILAPSFMLGLFAFIGICTTMIVLFLLLCEPEAVKRGFYKGLNRE